jgi:hypothetical protein
VELGGSELGMGGSVEEVDCHSESEPDEKGVVGDAASRAHHEHVYKQAQARHKGDERTAKHELVCLGVLRQDTEHDKGDDNNSGEHDAENKSRIRILPRTRVLELQQRNRAAKTARQKESKQQTKPFRERQKKKRKREGENTPLASGAGATVSVAKEENAAVHDREGVERSQRDDVGKAFDRHAQRHQSSEQSNQNLNARK